MEAGFYKFAGTLIHGHNWVRGPDFELRSETKDTYSYPVDGWYWFDSLEEACLFYNLNIDDYMPKEQL